MCNKEVGYAKATTVADAIYKKKVCRKCYALKRKQLLASGVYKNAMIGFHHTEATKELCRRAALNQFATKGYPFKGKHHTEESKRRIVEGHRKANLWKTYILPDSTTVKVQGWEPQTIDYLLNQCGYSQNDICIGLNKVPHISYNYSGSRTYYPDMYLINENTIVECKSEWTWQTQLTKNQQKISASNEQGYNVRLFIWNNHGTEIQKEINYCAI